MFCNLETTEWNEIEMPMLSFSPMLRICKFLERYILNLINMFKDFTFNLDSGWSCIRKTTFNFAGTALSPFRASPPHNFCTLKRYTIICAFRSIVLRRYSYSLYFYRIYKSRKLQYLFLPREARSIWEFGLERIFPRLVSPQWSRDREIDTIVGGTVFTCLLRPRR